MIRCAFSPLSYSALEVENVRGVRFKVAARSSELL